MEKCGLSGRQIRRIGGGGFGNEGRRECGWKDGDEER